MIPRRFREALNECITGVAKYPLTLSGPAGCGKTCTALCFCDRVKNAGMFEPNRFLSFEALAEEYQDALMDRLFDHGLSGCPQISPSEFWRRWECANLCVIDDLGQKDKVSDHRFETIKRALDSREGKPLVITTNLRISQIAALFDDRIASRIAGGTFVDITYTRPVDMRL